MPHLVLEGPITVEDIWLAFKPLELHEGGCHFRAPECYLSSDKRSLLVRSLIVERDFPKNFFVKMTEKEGEVTIGLEVLAAPERTDAVKRFLGFCAWQIIQAVPECVITRGNVQEFVSGPKAG